MRSPYPSSWWNSRRRHLGLMLLAALCAAFLSVVVLHCFRERRVLGLLLDERELQLLKLHVLLQEEREISDELKTEMKNMKAGIASLRSQKTELAHKLAKERNLGDYLKEKQAAMESTQEAKLSKFEEMEEKQAQTRLQITELSKQLWERESQVEELNHRIKYLTDKLENATTATSDGRTLADKSFVTRTQVENDVTLREGRRTGGESSREEKANGAATIQSVADNNGIRAEEQHEEIIRNGQPWPKLPTTNVLEQEDASKESGRLSTEEQEVHVSTEETQNRIDAEQEKGTQDGAETQGPDTITTTTHAEKNENVESNNGDEYREMVEQLKQNEMKIITNDDGLPGTDTKEDTQDGENLSENGVGTNENPVHDDRGDGDQTDHSSDGNSSVLQHMDKDQSQEEDPQRTHASDGSSHVSIPDKQATNASELLRTDDGKSVTDE